MASSILLRDTVTIFSPQGENDDGEMQYKTYNLYNVSCRVQRGASKRSDGDASADSITLYVFDTSSRVTSGGIALDTAKACDGIFGVIQEPEGDSGYRPYVAPYEASETLPARAMRILSVYRRKAGTPRMWHWEVHAK